jgi:hypothetical protein
MKERYPQLAVTAITNTPVIRTSRSKKINVEYEFQQALMAWITEGELPGKGKTATRELRLDGKVHFEISLKQFVDYKYGEPVIDRP